MAENYHIVDSVKTGYRRRVEVRCYPQYGCYVVIDTYEEAEYGDEGFECNDWQEAVQCRGSLCSVDDEPDWEAQEAYDREHGTVNGYDPHIEEWNAFHRNEMDC